VTASLSMINSFPEFTNVNTKFKLPGVPPNVKARCMCLGGGGIGNRIVGCRKGHRIISAIA